MTSGDVFVVGWSLDDWKQFHDLKVKANAFQLEVAYKIMKDELSVRAHRDIQLALMNDKGYSEVLE